MLHVININALSKVGNYLAYLEAIKTIRQEIMVVWVTWIIGEMMRSGWVLDIFEGSMNRICERIGCGVREERRSTGWLQDFFFKHLYWSIIALQCCVSVCCITKSVSYMHTYIPISPPSVSSSHLLIPPL